jgi:hypothetical protein
MTGQTMTFAALTLAAVLAHGGTVRADDWDVASVTDGGITTRNELFHGSEQVHDLNATGSLVGDQDWYRVLSSAWSSYQVVIDGMTGDLRLDGTDLQLLDEFGADVLSTSTLTEFGGNLSLVWIYPNAPPAAPLAQFVRIRGAACGTTCTTEDRYRVRFYDTTYTIPRFNNSGTQSTVLMVQNVTERTCKVQYLFQRPGGSPIDFRSIDVAPHGLDVFATPAHAPNQSGSVRIAHTCGYGGLSGKAVSVEPATGFTFDTQMVHRPH